MTFLRGIFLLRLLSVIDDGNFWNKTVVTLSVGVSAGHISTLNTTPRNIPETFGKQIAPRKDLQNIFSFDISNLFGPRNFFNNGFTIFDAPRNISIFDVDFFALTKFNVKILAEIFPSSFLTARIFFIAARHFYPQTY